jgi:hypothetical protein
MCFLFQGLDDPVEAFDVGSANATDHDVFQCSEMSLNAMCELSSFCRHSHHECAAICFANFARNQSAPCQPIENTG